MIKWISNWASAIIVAVIIATIIEMILPEGNCKKYIKVVLGVYILFAIISPVVSKFTGKSLDVSSIIDLNQYIEEAKEKEKIQNLLQEENSASIRDIYIGNLKADIQNKLKAKGYTVTEIKLDVGYDDNYTLKKITLSAITEDEKNIDEEQNTESINVINEIIIDISNRNEEIYNNKEEKSNLSNQDITKIKEYLSSVYEITEKNIVVN